MGKHDRGSLQKSTSVYVLRSTRDKSKRYVGETDISLDKRLRLHISYSYKGKNKLSK